MADLHNNSARPAALFGPSQRRLLAAASIALVLGVFVYLFDRPAEQVYFIPDALASLVQPLHILVSIADQLPTFLHVFAFSLFTIAVIGVSSSKVALACIGWCIGDSLFEIGQHPDVATVLVKYLPGWFSNVPFLEVAPAYFLSGTFDVFDLLSIFLGTFAAYICISLICPEESHYE